MIEIKKNDKIHYAPLISPPNLNIYRDGKVVPFSSPFSWSEYHDLYSSFAELNRQNKLTLLKTQEYGHSMFHGHRGMVQIFICNA